MNDLDLLTSIGDETPLPDPAALAPVRARVMAGIARRRRRRVLFSAAVAATAAAAAAATLAFVSGHPATPPAARARSTAGATAGSGPGSPAIRLLDLAAKAALTQRAVTPGAAQFVYLKDFDVSLGYTQTWTSVSETRNGLMKGDGDAAMTTRPCPAAGCDPYGRYLPGFPVTAAAVPGYLTRTFPGAAHDIDEFVVTEGAILNTAYLLPRQRAAFYTYLATIPGVSIRYGVRDAAGRQGTGLVWQTQGTTIMLIFNPDTYAYLGTSSDAVITEAIVNAPGQLPG
jgi:hypothetical protein